MGKKILILGATGTLGNPVTRCLADGDHTIRILTRRAEKARKMFDDMVEIVEGDSTNRNHIESAIDGCEAVHITLPAESELIAVQHVINSFTAKNLNLISYVSGTSVREENRWFKLIDVKMRAENLIRNSGIPYMIFCPTWVMEVLNKFVRGNRAAVIASKNPPAIHFFAAADFGRMVATAFEDTRVLGKRLYIHGPESITLPAALQAFLGACYPQVKVAHLKLWQARLIARITGRMDSVSRLIRYFDRVGELGDPTEADALLGAPSTTFGDWIESRKEGIG
ncbi:MAG: NmrA family NAD(P)-binding protein [Candidatus Zixiibacteriota bacterium]|nr:MAG: NmrA family NAD(P)-binding protein [candidate division Zixibacteria bacterium]